MLEAKPSACHAVNGDNRAKNVILKRVALTVENLTGTWEVSALRDGSEELNLIELTDIEIYICKF